VPAALPRQALLAPRRVPGDIAGDEHGLCCRPGRQPDRFGDWVAVPDHQVAAALAQLFPQHRERIGEEPRPVRRHGQRRVHHEERHHLAGAGARARQRGAVVQPQVAGEEHDGGVH
jgi:hypothetical protein